MSSKEFFVQKRDYLPRKCLIELKSNWQFMPSEERKKETNGCVEERKIKFPFL